jgi:amino acid transporter
METKSLVNPTERTSDYVTQSSRLNKFFGRKETLFFTVASVVGIDTIGVVSAAGPVAFSWMVILTLVFVIPSAMVFAELSAAFPSQGAPYMWVRLAFGRLAGAVSNVFYWIRNPIWFGGVLTIVAIIAAETFFMAGAQMSEFSFYRFGFAFIWIGIIAANFRYKVGKWVPALGTLARLLLLTLFTITLVAYGIKNGLRGVAFVDFGLSFPGLLAIIGVVLFSYLGLESQSNATEEMVDHKRDGIYAIFRGTGFAIAMFLIPIFAVLLVLPVDQVTGLTGFIDACKTAFTVYGGLIAEDNTVTLTGTGFYMGELAGVLIILTVFSSGVSWIMASSRALAVSGQDFTAPKSLGVINPRYGTPVRVNNLSGVIASITMVLAYKISDGNTAKYFGVALSVAITSTLITYFLIFPAFLQLRILYPDVKRPYFVPASRTISIWLTLVVSFGIAQILLPGIGEAWFSDTFRPAGWDASEGRIYFITALVPILAIKLIGVLFWAIGRFNLRRIERSELIASDEAEEVTEDSSDEIEVESVEEDIN